MSDDPRKLPIGIQTFRQIIADGYAYVDKTTHSLALAETGKAYFLSRPRRFGKSLFVDILNPSLSAQPNLPPIFNKLEFFRGRVSHYI